MRRACRNLLAIVLTLFLVVAGILYIWNNREDFASVGDISVGAFTLVVLLTALSWLVLGWCNLILFRVLGSDLDSVEWIGLTMVGALANIFLPVGAGTGLRAVYLKKIYDFPVSDFLPFTAAPLVMGLLVNSSVAFISVLGLRLAGVTQGYVVAAITGAMFLVSVSTLFLPGKYKTHESRILNWLSRVIASWKKISSNKSALCKLFLATLARTLLLTIVYALLADTLGYGGSFAAFLVMAGMGTISRLANITPASLGIYEGSVALSGSVMGLPAETGVLIALIHRAASMLIVVLSGTVFSNVLSRRMMADESH